MLTLAQIGCIATPKPVGYATTVEGLPGGPPLAYWRLGEPGGTTIHDRRPGNRHGAYAGSVAYGAPTLPQDSDGAVDFAGTGRGDIGHDAGLLLSALTISLWFKLHTIPPDAEPTQTYVLFSKDISGLNQGDFSIAVFDTGNLEVTFQTTSTVHKVIIPNIETNTPHHVVVRADSTGFDAYVNGQFIEKVDNYTGAWTSNVNPIGLARAPWSPVDANGVIDEVAIYPRVVTEAEVLALAQQDLLGQTPVAATDILVVPENAVTAIDVAANDTFVGQKTNLTIEIMSQPASGNSVAVNGNNDVDYTAGPVTGDQMRSFTYRITDANGQSNTATCSVTVQDGDVEAPSNAVCYTESEADTVTTNIAGLAAAVAAAPPGRNIRITAGTYSGGSITLDGQGTQANPIVIRPAGGLGTVTLSNVSITFAATSSYIVFEGFYRNGGRITMNGSTNRVDKCRFRQIGGDAIVVQACQDSRVSRCDFSDFLATTSAKSCIRIDKPNIANGTLRGLLIDYCYVHDINPNVGANGCEPIRSWSGQDVLDIGPAGAVVSIERCLFSNIHIPNEGELISLKSGGWAVRFCTILNVGLYTQFRQGHFGEIRSCWWENVGGSAAVNCWGKGHLIIGNRFIGNLKMRAAPAGSTTLEKQLVQFTSDYARADGNRIIGNVMDTGAIEVGTYWPNADPRDEPAINNNLWNNTGTTVLDPTWQTGTAFNEDNEPYVPATKLTPADVGLNAPDPLCGAGG